MWEPSGHRFRYDRVSAWKTSRIRLRATHVRGNQVFVRSSASRAGPGTAESLGTILRRAWKEMERPAEQVLAHRLGNRDKVALLLLPLWFSPSRFFLRFLWSNFADSCAEIRKVSVWSGMSFRLCLLRHRFKTLVDWFTHFFQFVRLSFN